MMDRTCGAASEGVELRFAESLESHDDVNDDLVGRSGFGARERSDGTRVGARERYGRVFGKRECTHAASVRVGFFFLGKI